MAKVIGPLHSISAHGDFAKQLTFRRVLSNNVVSGYVKPTDRRTEAQTAHRLGMRQARAAWRALSLKQKNLWREQAIGLPGISGYNLFIKQYLESYYSDIKPIFDTKNFNEVHFC